MRFESERDYLPRLVVNFSFLKESKGVATHSIRKLVGHAAQQKQEEEEKLMLQKARELDAFDQKNSRSCTAVQRQESYKNGFNRANGVMVTSSEEEALRNMKGFRLPSATADAPVKSEAPSPSTQ